MGLFIIQKKPDFDHRRPARPYKPQGILARPHRDLIKQRSGRIRSISLLCSVAAVVALTTACGGGEGGSDTPAPPTTAQGLYSGSTGTGRVVTGLVLDDGTYYFLYSVIGSSNVIPGVVQGSGSTSASAFTSSNTRDFNLEGLGVLPATLNATFTAKQSISGTVAYSQASPDTFSGTYDTAYEATPSLTALAGTFTGQVASSAGAENATVVGSSNGTLSGAGASGCATTGTVASRSQRNVFNISLTFGGSPCLFANQTLTGIAYFNAAMRALYAATPNSARTDGVLFVGGKP